MKKLLMLAAVLAATSAKLAARDGFAIVIDPRSHAEARAEVKAYADAIEQKNNLKVFIVEDRWGVPDSIRAALKQLHEQKNEPIVGAVLVGDIPVAMIRDAQHLTSAFKMDQTRDRQESSVPSDRFYDDFSLRFESLGRDEKEPYFYYSLTAESAQRLHPDIYSGRIRPTDVGGTSRYAKLRAFLSKATAQKLQPRELNQLFFFSGHGYISDSKVARMDEKIAWMEHFPQLRGRENHFSYIDHSDHYPVKETVMNELMRTDLDLAVLHHHGFFDTEYFNGSPKLQTVAQAKEFIRQSVREHIVSAKKKGKDWEETKKKLTERFDLPESWVADALDPALSVQDSLDDASTDLHLEDFAVYGFKPNAPVVVIDACFCGSFHLENCIANEYIFQPGGTVAVVANTVNVLQDKWSDRLMGLIAEGGCVGDVVRFSTYLESHVIGDPTYRFATPGHDALNLDHLLIENKPSAWRAMLKSPLPERQSLAIEQLANLGQITSAELRRIYEQSPYGIVRLMALMKIADFRDDNFLAVVNAASQDSYELLQRQAIRMIHNSGDDRLAPALIKLSISNNTSDRVNFDAKMALGVMKSDVLMNEFRRQWADPAVCYVRKDSVGNLIGRSIERLATSAEQNIAQVASDSLTAKQKKFVIRSQRNNLVHAAVPMLLDCVEQSKVEPDLQVMILEALGWHPYSYMAPTIAQRSLSISRDERFEPAVRREALKTYNRIQAR